MFLAGWILLLVAILLNGLANKLGIDTWYPFLNEVSKSGFVKSLSKTSYLSKLFLFIIYPGLLGVTALLVAKILKLGVTK